MATAFIKKSLFSIGIIFLFSASNANAIEMAVTIDDLPGPVVVSQNITALDVTKQMLSVFDKHNIKGVYGFMTAYAIRPDPNDKQILKQWVLRGHLLANHTFSHANLSKVRIWQYMDDIELNEYYLSPLMIGKDYKYFRYPFSEEGSNKQTHDIIYNFLLDEHYQIAYITLNFNDYLWGNAYARCLHNNDKKSIYLLKKSFLDEAINAIVIDEKISQQLFGRQIKFILLLHFQMIDAAMLDQLLTAYEAMGVKFIPLSAALNDDVYQVPVNHARKLLPRQTRLSKFSLLDALQHKYIYMLASGVSGQVFPLDIYRQVLGQYQKPPAVKLDSICR
jgi:peptidoglycan/xylan/chitin deacetylase (PgdA/CDA1 family)